MDPALNENPGITVNTNEIANQRKPLWKSKMFRIGVPLFLFGFAAWYSEANSVAWGLFEGPAYTIAMVGMLLLTIAFLSASIGRILKLFFLLVIVLLFLYMSPNIASFFFRVLSYGTYGERSCYLIPPTHDRYYQVRECMTDVAIRTNNDNLCKGIGYTCVDKYAQYLSDENKCELLSTGAGELFYGDNFAYSNEDDRNTCYEIMAEYKKDINICNKITVLDSNSGSSKMNCISVLMDEGVRSSIESDPTFNEAINRVKIANEAFDNNRKIENGMDDLTSCAHNYFDKNKTYIGAKDRCLLSMQDFNLTIRSSGAENSKFSISSDGQSFCIKTYLPGNSTFYCTNNSAYYRQGAGNSISRLDSEPKCSETNFTCDASGIKNVATLSASAINDFAEYIPTPSLSPFQLSQEELDDWRKNGQMQDVMYSLTAYANTYFNKNKTYIGVIDYYATINSKLRIEPSLDYSLKMYGAEQSAFNISPDGQNFCIEAYWPGDAIFYCTSNSNGLVDKNVTNIIKNYKSNPKCSETYFACE